MKQSTDIHYMFNDRILHINCDKLETKSLGRRFILEERSLL